ncbi:deaminase [Tsukamurella pulmonis]|uniref:Dihydrofolate reductase n=1 Tax=Tsukamurella pulmonis TaxID=47312 RepID=A0A1H1CPB2_9ACTN|nr:dihydrofolate reductase family protein [Tsukamurella pulmonis]KXO89814.1 deaminase [Tsukamurella pulmonis]SDQ66054.1 Dihydrofolate reductase [Tsukamurella pulmonis]SUP23370.1 RibD C-terminal domain [Tsukamurella pulmonis]
MRSVTYSLSTSADGYITSPDGSLDWGAPDKEVFRFATDEVRGLAVHLMGRRLYETMLYWEDAEETQPLDDDERVFARVWNALPKVVFSTTLTEVRGANTRLAAGGLGDEIARLRAEPGEGNIGVGGAGLAAEAARIGALDEYRVRVYPVLLGGGIPYFPQHGVTTALERIGGRSFECGVDFVHYRVLH